MQDIYKDLQLLEDEQEEQDKDLILDMLDSLTHFYREDEDESVRVPWYCMLSDVASDFGYSEKEMSDFAQDNGYIVFKISPIGSFEGGLAIADKDVDIDVVKENVRKAVVDDFEEEKDIPEVKISFREQESLKEDIDVKHGDVKNAPYVVDADGEKFAFDTKHNMDAFIERNKHSFNKIDVVRCLDEDLKEKPWFMQQGENGEPEYLGFAKSQDDMLDKMVKDRRSNAIHENTYIDELDKDTYLYMKEQGNFSEDEINELNKYFGIEESLKEESKGKFIKCPDEELERLEKELDEIGFKVVSTHPGWDDTEIHYQIITKEGNQDDDSFEEYIEKFEELLDRFEEETGAPCTFNMGLQHDGYISCGFDVRGIYYVPGEDRVPGRNGFKLSFRNGKPADDYTKAQLKDIANHLNMSDDEVLKAFPLDKKNEGLEDMQVSSYHHLVKVVDRDRNLITQKLFNSRPQVDRFVDKYNDVLFDMKIDKNEYEHLDNGKEFFGTIYTIIIIKEEDLEEDYDERYLKGFNQEYKKELIKQYKDDDVWYVKVNGWDNKGNKYKNPLDSTTTFDNAYKAFVDFDASNCSMSCFVSLMCREEVDEGETDIDNSYVDRVVMKRYVYNGAETLDEDLEEDIEKHDTLNDKLFENNELKPEVKEAIQNIASTFIDELQEDGIALTLKDIILVGSNVSYNYTKDSDLDVHLIVDSSALDCPKEIVDKLYGAYRSIFNKNYDITIKGIPAEIYVELDEPKVNSNGVYSINNGWVKEPIQQDIPDLDREAFDKLFNEWQDKYAQLLDKEDLTSEEVKQFIEDVYTLRKEGIASGGEYALGNLVFKEFRNLGQLDDLKELRKELKGKELSLESIDNDSKNSYNDNDMKEELVNDKDAFWNIRDSISKVASDKYDEVNLILDNNEIRPITKDELKNKFAVSIEHANEDDYKSKEELEKVASETNALKVMFFVYKGQYGGEYSFLYDDEDVARKIAKEYNQKAYAKFDENGNYNEVLVEALKESENMNYEELNSLIEKLYEHLKEFNVHYEIWWDEDDTICAEINWGDWKHDHLWFDHEAEKFLKSLGYDVVNVNVDVTEEDGSDTYSAIHSLQLKKTPDELKNESLNEDASRVEYCVMDKQNNNIECFDSLEDAIAFAKDNKGVRALEVRYGPKDEHGDETELGAEEVWSLEEESLEEKREMRKGEQIAKLVAQGFKGRVGPFGGEDPYLDGNILTLTSQGPNSIYRFNDDGSVDDISFEDKDDNFIYRWLVDNGWDEEDIDDEVINDYRTHHFDSVQDLLDDMEYSTWFLYFEDENPQLYNKICDLLEK